MIKGKLIDDHTRCIHWHSPLDVIAIKFKCCNTYYPCLQCHSELTDHRAEVWRKDERNEKAVLCGVCKNEMSIDDYLGSNNTCPFCNSSFNPKCSLHYHLYFEI